MADSLLDAKLRYTHLVNYLSPDDRLDTNLRKELEATISAIDAKIARREEPAAPTTETGKPPRR